MLLLNKTTSLSSARYSYHEIILKNNSCIKIGLPTMIAQVKIFCIPHSYTYNLYV